jgi:diaminopimelate epimerase
LGTEKAPEHRVGLNPKERNFLSLSGAREAVVVGRRRGLLSDTVQVEFQRGRLEVRWPGPGEAVSMTGPAEHVYDGRVEV